MGTTQEDLLRPEAYPFSISLPVELRETHISWVFLTEKLVFKIKKPVNLGFLDFRSLEKRHRACQLEVTLNERLAPDVYQGVVPVMRRRDGTHTIGLLDDTAQIVDWAVQMVRLPDDIRADVLLQNNQLTVAHIDQLAEHIAQFHARARVDAQTSSFGAPEVVQQNITENFRQTRDSIESYISATQAQEIERWQTEFLKTNDALFRGRMTAERVRDGHGDLRLEHVYFTHRGISVLDCIEFNERFRYADVCADAAFVSMDLACAERADLAERFLAKYALHSNDYDLYTLIDFYESYRAYVRGKVASIIATNKETDAVTKERIQKAARNYFLFSVAAKRQPLLPPTVVCVGGLLGSGKSTLADRISLELGAPVVEADRTRKHILSLEPTQKIHVPAWKGAYDSSTTDRVYEEVFRRGRCVLESGRPIVLDASFRSQTHRAAAKNRATKHNVPFYFLECKAPKETCRARLQERERHASTSDGRVEIFDEFCADFEAIKELPSNEHFIVDTSHSLDANLTWLREMLPVWPKNLKH